MSKPVIIVGGGLVGNSLAIALAKNNIPVTIIETRDLDTQIHHPSSNRAIVLSAGSRNILDSIGVWQHLSEHVTPVTHIHVGQQKSFGAVRIDASEYDLPALGYVVTAGVLAQQLVVAMQDLPIEIHYQATFESLTQDNTVVTINKAGQLLDLDASLVVAADGSHSAVRQAVGIETDIYDYPQHVVVSKVKLARAHDNVAYERFTPEGPLAMLPLDKEHYTLVWTVKTDHLNAVLQLSPDDFKTKLQQSFGYRLGRFESVSKPVDFPLQLIRAKELYQQNLVVIGNAAHTIHPIAGQGLNLGLRDVATLLEKVIKAKKAKQPINHTKLLQSYADARLWDYRRIINLTHALVGIFSNSLLILALSRTTGFVLLQRIPALRKLLARTTMGMLGAQDPFSHGIPLEEVIDAL